MIHAPSCSDFFAQLHNFELSYNHRAEQYSSPDFVAEFSVDHPPELKVTFSYAITISPYTSCFIKMSSEAGMEWEKSYGLGSRRPYSDSTRNFLKKALHTVNSFKSTRAISWTVSVV